MCCSEIGCVQDNNLADHNGRFQRVGVWTVDGFRVPPKLDLRIVAFRDDVGEVYSFSKVAARYKKTK